MLIFYPMLSNGNIFWTCDSCGNTAEVSAPNTNAVALFCSCDNKVHPRCNNDCYNKGLYWERIPIEKRNEYREDRD